MHASKEQKRINSPTAWWLAVRPKTLWAAVCPVLLGGMLALRVGSDQPITFLLILITALLIQIATNLANDLIDARRGTDTAERIGPTRVVQSELLSERQVQYALNGVLGLALLTGVYLVYLGGWPILLIGVSALICTIWYSAGPVALSYTGLADLFVCLFFGPLAVAGTLYLLVGVWSQDAMVVGLAPGLISTAVLTANNLRDYWTDKSAGKKTLVVRFGLLFGRLEYSLCIIGACILPLVPGTTTTRACRVAAATLIFALPLLVRAWRAKNATEFLPLLPGAAKLLIVYAALFGIGLFLW